MDIQFQQPLFFILIAACAGLWFVPRRDLKHWLIRSACLILLATGLARPILIQPSTQRHLVFVLDRSESVSGQDLQATEAKLATVLNNLSRGTKATVVYIPLDATAAKGETPLDLPNCQLIRIGSHRADQSRSPLGAALAVAANSIPRNGSGAITLVSDGLATDKDWAAEVQAISQRDIVFNWVPMNRRPDDVYPIRMTTPNQLRVGHTAQVRVTLNGQGQTCQLILKDTLRTDNNSDNVLTKSTVDVQGQVTATLEFTPKRVGPTNLEVQVVTTNGTDALTTNNSVMETVYVDEPLKVLYLGHRLTGSEKQFGELLGKGFQVQTANSGAEPQDLSTFDAIVIDDRPAKLMAPALRNRISQAVVNHGTGLFVAGGRSAFGPGGFQKTKLAQIMPVEFIQKEEKRDPSTTLVVIIDTSGSMTGQRVQIAKEVARLAMRRLLPHDKVGVVEFYGAKRWAAPIQAASNAIELQRAINRLSAGGGTVILPAIEEAFYAMQNVRTRFKHVLVLTDGGVEQGAFEPLLRKMSDKGINVSTVLVGGRAHSEFLVNLSNWGKGRFYSAANRFDLPEVILKQPTTARIPAYRPGSYPVQLHGGSGWWGKIDPKSVPELRGYVETRSRPQAETLIETTNTKHPILASWQYGLGRVTTLMTEPTGAGTQSWHNWQAYPRLLARIVARTAKSAGNPFAVKFVQRDWQLDVQVRRLVNEDWTPLLARKDATGKMVNLPLRETAPGIFTTSLVRPYPLATGAVSAKENPALTESLEVEVGVRELPNRKKQHFVSHLTSDFGNELRIDPRKQFPGDRVAQATGGKTVAIKDLDQQEWAVGAGKSPVEVIKLWPYLLLASLLFYLGDLTYRRWDAG